MAVSKYTAAMPTTAAVLFEDDDEKEDIITQRVQLLC